MIGTSGFRIKQRLVMFLTACLLIAGGLGHPAFADRLSDAENLVGKLIAELERIEAQGDSISEEARKKALSGLMDSYFDVEGITRFSAGPYWRAASKEQREAYSAVFRGVLLTEASTRFQQILNFSFTPTKVEARGDKLILVTGIAMDNSGEFPDTVVIWRLSAIKNAPIQIIDLEIENISMLKTQQDENTALIKRNGGDFDALIEAMRSRFEAVKASASQ